MVSSANLRQSEKSRGSRSRLHSTLTIVCAVLFGIAVFAAPANAQSFTPDAALKGHGGPIRAVTTLADGSVVTAGFDSAVIVWDPSSGTARRVLRFHDGTVNALASGGGTCFASAGEDSRVAIWCGDDREPRRVLTGHTGPIAGLAWSGSWLASASWDRTVRLWFVPPSPRTTPDSIGITASTSALTGHDGPVNAVAFVGSNAVVSGGYDGQIRLTPIVDGRPQQGRVRNIGLPVNAIAVTRSGDIVAATAEGQIRVFDLQLEPIGEFAPGQGPLNAVAVTPDGRRLAAAGMRTPVTLIDLATRQTEREILGPGLPVWALAFSADGARLVTGGADRALRIWNAATGEAIAASAAEAWDPAAAPAERGAQVFRACRACHGLTPDDTNKAGPTLAGTFGRRIASLPGYTFSPALKTLDIVWTPETVAKLFEVGPTIYTPGTKMPEQRITDAEDRKALVDWLAKVTVHAK